jgi:subtilisin family serine protease
MEREYTVIANTREDLPALEAEITASSGAGPIPDRSVDVANPRLGSKIQTHFMLTDEEAEELRKDPRVRAVEIPPEQRDDISIGLNASQRGTFYRGSGLQSDYRNWGLRRCMADANNFVDTDGITRLTEIEGQYEYAVDGTGVDVVIQDSGIDPLHPDWFDSGTTSRLQQIDWYTESGLSGTQDANHYGDYDGHGTHCASIAAGKLYGWAKGAHIYSQKLAGLEGPSDPGTGISISDAFDTIRLWHNNKTNGRPTVVNMSWGYGATLSTDPTTGVYRGTAWTYGVDYNTRSELEDATGVSRDRFIDAGSNTFFRQATRVASVDAEVEDMITDGIHICIAAGNNYNKIDVVGGSDYNNTVVFNGNTYNYHRGSSPYSDNCFMVGNIDDSFSAYLAETYTDQEKALDQTASSSSRGPGVNIWAPGSEITAATSRVTDGYTTIEYPVDVSSVPGLGGLFFRVTSIGGTSMAAPQVAGVIAQHLQVNPNLTPAQIKDRIIGDSTAVVYDTGSSTDYGRILDSIMGSPNRMLYSRYGKQPLTTNVSPYIFTVT